MTAQEYIQNQLGKFLAQHNIDDVDIIIQKPKDEKHGDFACNLAMQLARHLRKKPLDIAKDICDAFEVNDSLISKVEIAGPGFLNFFAAKDNLYQQLANIFPNRETYGRTESAKGKTAQIEFVSANPTGPLTIGHGRGAVFGDTIARLLDAIGYDVTREYYFNNAGRQMRVLGESVRFRYLQELGQGIEFPEDYYHGEYITDIAKELIKEHGDKLAKETDNPIFKDTAEKLIFADIRKTIKRMGFEFDVFYNEKSLYDEGKIDEVVKELNKKGLIACRENATWFLTSKLGFDQDRVFVKSTGEPTYRLPDTAYHVEKVKRGFDLIIDIFGADHIATYPDVLAAVKALGYDIEKFKVLIHQFVTLTENGETVKMSTRKANFITLDELMDDVGEDVTRYFFLMRNMNAHLNFDLGLARTQSDENPVFYIQYAHARICSIQKLAETKNLVFDTAANLELLQENEELTLIKHLLAFPAIVEASAVNYEPHRLVNYLFELASLFHKFYTVCRVVMDDKDLSVARLTLIEATKIVFANGLGFLGISAPEQM